MISEKFNYVKEQITEEIYAILNDAQLCDDEEYEGEHDEMGIDGFDRTYGAFIYWWWLRTILKILNTLDFDKDNFLGQDNGLKNEMDGDQDDLNNLFENWMKKD